MATCGYAHNRDGTSTLLTEEMKKGWLSGTWLPKYASIAFYILCIFFSSILPTRNPSVCCQLHSICEEGSETLLSDSSHESPSRDIRPQGILLL